MSDKRKGDAKAIDRAFDPAILVRARKAVEDYQFAFWMEDDRYVGRCVELDTLGTGPTIAKCIEEAKSLAVTSAAYLLEAGKRLPLPVKRQARTVQVNIRLSPAEKKAIEEAAHAAGFRGLSDYLRVRGLSAA